MRASKFTDAQKAFMDLSRFRSDPEFHLSCLSFECQGTFPSEG
jgi:hypothetical protein